MSSPTIGRLAFLKRFDQYSSRAMKTGMQFTKPQAGLEDLLDVPTWFGLLGPDRQVGDDDVGLRLLEDLDRCRPSGRGRLGDLLGEVLAKAVVRHPAHEPRSPRFRDVGELDRVFWPDQIASDRSLPTLSESMSNAALELDVADVVAAEVDVA